MRQMCAVSATRMGNTNALLVAQGAELALRRIMAALETIGAER